MNQWVAKAAAQWPLGIAVLALLSLLFLPRFISSSRSPEKSARLELDRLHRDVESDPVGAEPRVAEFVVRHAGGPFQAEAQALLGEAVVRQGRGLRFPGAASLRQGWSALARALELGAPREAVDGFRREIAELGLEYGLAGDSIDRYTDLHRSTGSPEFLLGLARALAMRAAANPALRQALLDEASVRLSDYLRVAPPDRRLAGLRAQMRLCAIARRDEELLRVAVQGLGEARTADDRARLQLERGRALARLGRKTEALAALDEAERLAAEPLIQGVAAVEQGALLLRSGNPEGAEICRRVVSGAGPALPFARIALGESRLPSRAADGMDAILEGLRGIARPRLIEDAGVELSGVAAGLRAAGARDADGALLDRGLAILLEFERLFPQVADYALDRATLFLGARRHAEAADQFLLASELGDGELRARALRSAADACFDGRLFVRAAALHRRYYELRPATNLDGLLRCGVSLRHDGQVEPARIVFEEVAAKPGPLAGAALLEEAGMLAEAARSSEALAVYERVASVSAAPDDRAAAQIGRARVLLELRRPDEAGLALAGFLDQPPTAPRRLDALALRVRVAIHQQQWRAGLGRLRDLDDAAAALPPATRAAHATLLREARYTEGDLQFGLGEYAAAVRAYEEALRLDPDSPERLWGLIGRARALSRLERLEEARREYENALAIYRRTMPVLKESMAGFGPEYWQSALDALAKEVR